MHLATTATPAGVGMELGSVFRRLPGPWRAEILAVWFDIEPREAAPGDRATDRG